MTKIKNKKRFKKVVKYSDFKDREYFGISVFAYFIFILGMSSANPNGILIAVAGLHWYNFLWLPILLFIIWIIIKLSFREVYWEEIK